MRKTPLFVVASLTFVTAALADDPPTKPAGPPAGAAAKHENKVTPEAKAAFEKMRKTANCAVQKGLKDASGTISTEVPQIGTISMKFTVRANGAVDVETDSNAQGPSAMIGRNFAHAAEMVLRLGLGVFQPADDAEYDAEIAKKDGKDVVSVTNYKDGAVQSHVDFATDAEGLVVSGSSTRTMQGRDGKAREMKADMTYMWTKTGDSYRLDKIESATQMGKSTVDVVFADAGGYAFPISWKSTTPRGAVELKVTDLVVDGKKVEIKPAAPEKKPDAPAPKDDGGDKK